VAARNVRLRSTESSRPVADDSARPGASLVAPSTSAGTASAPTLVSATASRQSTAVAAVVANTNDSPLPSSKVPMYSPSARPRLDSGYQSLRKRIPGTYTPATNSPERNRRPAPTTTPSATAANARVGSAMPTAPTEMIHRGE